MWGVGGGVVCKVIFVSNPTVVLCCVEVRVRVGVLTTIHNLGTKFQFDLFLKCSQMVRG